MPTAETGDVGSALAFVAAVMAATAGAAAKAAKIVRRGMAVFEPLQKIKHRERIQILRLPFSGVQER